MERVDLSKVEFTPELRACVQAATAHLYETVPVRANPQKIILALAPMHFLQARTDKMQSLQKELQFALHRDVDFMVADRDQIRQYVRILYGESQDSSAA